MNELFVQSHIPGILLLLPSLPQPYIQAGGRILSFRARGDVEVSMSWTGRSIDEGITSKPYVNNDWMIHAGYGGKVLGLKLHFKQYHPWYNYKYDIDENILSKATKVITKTYGGMFESQRGYFQCKTNNNNENNTSNDKLNHKTLKSLKLMKSIVYISYPNSKSKLRLIISKNINNNNESCANDLTNNIYMLNNIYMGVEYHNSNDKINDSNSDSNSSDIKNNSKRNSKSISFIIEILSFPCKILFCKNSKKSNLDETELLCKNSINWN